MAQRRIDYFFNDFAHAFFGYSREAILGKHIGILLPPQASNGNDLPGMVQEILDHPERYVNKINENICSDGRRVWMAWTNRPIFDQDGNVSEILSVGVDTTARIRVEAYLQQSEAQFRQLADAMPQLVWTANPDGQVDYYNQRHEEYDGIEWMPDGAYQWAPVLHHEDEKPTQKAWEEAVRNGETYRIEHRVRLADGGYHWHLSRAIPVHDTQGRIVKWFGTATDIDKVKQAENELRTINETLERRVAERTAIANMRTMQLQSLAVELIEAEERERRRIAQLLHDDLQQMLASAKLQLETATDNDADHPTLEKVGQILRAAIAQARQLSHELSPPVLTHVNLFASLKWLVRRFKDNRIGPAQPAGTRQLHGRQPGDRKCFRSRLPFYPDGSHRSGRHLRAKSANYRPGTQPADRIGSW
ncbi:PAS domain S-box protein [Desulfosarcina sp.]|uniref:PAS domain-containing sensor histidine kinase n=1 Tax=Desulfosarcina sp. TaxID=2027861 RepID=UPI003970694E